MPIIGITESFENYKEFESNLSFSTNGTPEKLYVVLYKREVNLAGMVKRIEKKPLVVFLLPDNTEVPKRKWTPEMKSKAAEYTRDFPVSNYGKKLTLFGKIFYAAFGILIAGICATVVYFAIFNAPKLKENKANFAAIPKIGDLYYGSLSKAPTKNTDFYSTHSWIKIIAINTADSICSYSLSTKPGNYNLNTLEEEHVNFSAEILKGKFTYDEKVKIKSEDYTIRFEASVINNEYNKYKISAKLP